MERGQTAHDYLIGVTVMLLTLAGTFALVPGLFTPFQEPVAGDEQTMADRLADDLVEQHQMPRRSNTIKSGSLDTALEDDNFENTLARSGIPRSGINVNVTVDGGNLDGGDPYTTDEGAAATSIRIVRFDTDVCDPACRLIVRVWT